MRFLFASTALTVILATGATAQDTNARIGLGLSTMGATLEGAYRFNDRFALRGVVAGGINTNTLGGGTQTIDGVTYTTNGQLGGFALLADYYTGSTGFRLSGGAFVSNTSFTGSTTASPTNPIEIGNTTLTGGETASATVEFRNRVSPMLTVGWDQNIGRNFTLSAEVGAIAMGGLNVDVTAPAAPAADVARERQNIVDELSQFGVFPYVGLTAAFRF